MEADSDDEDEGGLDLLAAQQRMRKEDVRDKEMYRQRVKAMHKVDICCQFLCSCVRHTRKQVSIQFCLLSNQMPVECTTVQKARLRRWFPPET